MRVLICGDRDWTDDLFIRDMLAGLPSPPEIVIQGEARGADTLGRKAAEALGIPVLSFPANWNRYGRGAGPIRNQQMLDEGKPRALKANIACVLYYHQEGIPNRQWRIF